MLFTLWTRISYFLKDFTLYILLILASSLALIYFFLKIFTSQYSQTKKKILISLFFTLFVFVLTFSTFEAYFRYFYDESDGLGYLKVTERWHKRHVVFNNYFFRDRDFNVNKKEGITRIGVLGDSITQGNGVKDVNNRFSNLLEQKLKKAGHSVEVYNIGKSGYDTEGEIELYNQVKHLNFDIIVWEYFINDIQPRDASTGTPIIAKNIHKAKILEFISDRSFFLDFLYWRFSSVYDKTIFALRNADINQYKNDAILKTHEENITNFINSLKADKNKKVVVIMFPSLYLLNSNDYPIFINNIMTAHFKQNGVDVIDLYPDLKGKNSKDLMANRFDSHPNEIVHELAAQKLFEKVSLMLNK